MAWLKVSSTLPNLWVSAMVTYWPIPHSTPCTDGFSLMKTLLLSAVLMISPLAAQAACAPTDFVIKEFKTSFTGAGSSAKLTLSGELVNNCAEASAAEIRIEAKNDSGEVVQSKQGWPAGTTNIAPGGTAKFDLGRQFRLQANITNYAVNVIAVRAW